MADVAQELGCGYGMTCWRRLRDWQAEGIWDLLAIRRTAHGSGLGRWRCVVERTFAWLNQFRRLRVRYGKRADIHEAFLSLACALMVGIPCEKADAQVSGWRPLAFASGHFIARISHDACR